MYQGYRGIWKKNNIKMIGVAITADSRRERRSHGATRYWIVAPRWTNVELKKPSPAHRQIVEWSFLPDIIIIIIIIIIYRPINLISQVVGQPAVVQFTTDTENLENLCSSYNDRVKQLLQQYCEFINKKDNVWTT